MWSIIQIREFFRVVFAHDIFRKTYTLIDFFLILLVSYIIRLNSITSFILYHIIIIMVCIPYQAVPY